MKQHFELLASYNQWMNLKVYEAAGHLDDAELTRDRGAFFGSILGTLNHIVVGDTLWLKRFAMHPACQETLHQVNELPTPTSLDQILFQDFDELAGHRQWLDEQIIGWVDSLAEGDLDYVFTYHNSKGIRSSRKYSSLMLHFFNHQTHHRGQVSTLLSQVGEDLGITDLLVLIPQE